MTYRMPHIATRATLHAPSVALSSFLFPFTPTVVSRALFLTSLSHLLFPILASPHLPRSTLQTPNTPPFLSLFLFPIPFSFPSSSVSPVSSVFPLSPLAWCNVWCNVWWSSLLYSRLVLVSLVCSFLFHLVLFPPYFPPLSSSYPPLLLSPLFLSLYSPVKYNTPPKPNTPIHPNNTSKPTPKHHSIQTAQARHSPPSRHPPTYQVYVAFPNKQSLSLSSVLFARVPSLVRALPSFLFPSCGFSGSVSPHSSHAAPSHLSLSPSASRPFYSFPLFSAHDSLLSLILYSFISHSLLSCSLPVSH